MEKGKICLLLICVAIVAFLEGNALTGRNCAVRTGALENRTADQDEAVVALTSMTALIRSTRRRCWMA
ncbi:hypothetical protein DXA96_00880 [Lachnospiraceae bacterium OF09-33XD]|nr:hypothetical protein DXA96_00880 [Lachnospiraceae bacterium OF09-33XD]